MGDYLAGRLRTRWTDVHTDEVYFRDTAHGFLAWAVSSLATAALLTSVIGSIVGGVQAGASVVGGVAGTASSVVGSTVASARTEQGNDGGPMGYFVDSLFRRDAATAAPSTAPAGNAVGTDANERDFGNHTAEVSRIFMNVDQAEPLPPEDLRYVGQLDSP